MRIKLLLFVIVLGLAVMLGVQVHNHPGYVVIAYGKTSIEMTLWFAILAALITFIAFSTLLRVLRGLLHLPKRLRQSCRRRRIKKIQDATQQGVCALLEGRWQQAEKQFSQFCDADQPLALTNALGAALAAQRREDHLRRDQYLQQAYQIAPRAKLAVGLAQAQLHLEAEQLEQALAVLQALQASYPQCPAMLFLLQQVYRRLNDWNGVKQLLLGLKRQNVLKPKQFHALACQTYIRLLTQAKQQNDWNALQTLWKELSKSLQQEPKLLALYTAALLDAGEHARAEQVLKRALKHDWNSDLLMLYGELQTQKPAHQLKQLEAWQEQHPNDAVLLFVLGKVCARNQLWGKAQKYLQVSLQLEPRVEAYAELGHVLEKLGDAQGALNYYKKGYEQKLGGTIF